MRPSPSQKAMWSARASSPYVTRSPGLSASVDDGLRGVLLLVGVAGDEPAGGAEAHVHEP